MPKIEVRPAISSDIPILISLDHIYTSAYTWQMEILQEENAIEIGFRETRLPRSVRIDYPRSPAHLADDWTKYDGLLVASNKDEVVGYIGLNLNTAPSTTWISDVVVAHSLRHQGVGSVLVLAAQAWGLQHHAMRIVLEMQPKNYPAIQFAKKLGFNFCGYNDCYYANHDIALFFARSLR
jgi:GNAT superfamily N-acetyltransferase